MFFRGKIDILAGVTDLEATHRYGVMALGARGELCVGPHKANDFAADDAGLQLY